MNNPRILQYVLALSLICGCGSIAFGQGPPSTWESLTPETFAAARAPDGEAIARVLTDSTKVGSVLFSQTRLDKLRDLIKEATDDDEEGFLAKLARYGFSVEDMPQLLSGETGIAYLHPQDAEDDARGLIVFWAQSGEELANRIIDAVKRAVEDQEDDEFPIRRNDISLADTDVIQLRAPDLEVVMDEYEMPDIDDFDDIEEWRKARAELLREIVDEGEATVSYDTALLTQIRGTLLVAISSDSVSEESIEEESTQLEGVFARLIGSHDDLASEFVLATSSVAGVRSGISSPGEPALEVLWDVPRTRNLMMKSVEGEPFEKVAEMFGIEQLGPISAGFSLEDAAMHSTFFVGMASPRRGMMRLLDQDSIPFDPPEWAPATAVTFNQFSIDLERVWGIVREEMGEAFPDQFAMIEQRVNQQLQQLANVNVEELTSAFGNRHVGIGFPFEMIEVEVFDGETLQIPRERFAVVIEVRDADIVSRVMGAARKFAAIAPGAEPTEEQGFSGIRFTRGNGEQAMQGAVMVNSDHLVISVGKDVLPVVLSCLREAPEGEDALINSAMMRRARELMDVGSGVRNEVVDANHYLGAVIKQIRELGPGSDASDEDDDLAIEDRVLAIFLPTEAEAKDLFGVTVSNFDMNDDGMLIRSVTELPQNEED